MSSSWAWLDLFARFEGAGWLIKATVLFSLAWITLRLPVRLSASVRHFLAVCAVLGSVVLPALILALPEWEVLPSPSSQIVTGSRLFEGVKSRGGKVERRVVSPTIGSDLGGVETPETPLSVHDESRRMRIDGAGILRALWVGGVVWFLALFALRMEATRRIVRKAPRLRDPRAAAILRGLKRDLGLSVPVALLRGEARSMPMVWGVRRPVILLPEESASWSRDQLHSVLLHELAHIVRNDVLMMTSTHFARALHWFHPLAWILQRRLAVERERACDDIALQQGLEATLYADHLVQIASACGSFRGVAPFMAGRSQLEERIMAILDVGHNRRSVPQAAGLGIATFLFAGLVPLASLGWARSEPISVENQSRRSDQSIFREHLETAHYDLDDVVGLIDGLSGGSELTRAACAWALGKAGDLTAVDSLIDSLGDRVPRVREWVVRSLATLGSERAVPSLIETLDDRHSAVREWVVRALGSLRDERAVVPLLDHLSDEMAQVRQWVVRSLGEFKDPRSLEPMIAALEDEDAEVRQWVVRSLGEFRNDRVVAPLMERLSDEDPEVREWALRSLRDFDDQRVLPSLLDKVSDEDAAVREWAVRSLEGYRSWRSRVADPEVGLSGGHSGLGTGKARSETHPGVVAALVIGLGASEPEVREAAARALGTIRDSSAVLPLLGRLEDRDPGVREAVVRSLADLQDPRALQGLIDRLDDENAEVRQWAVRAVGGSKDPRVGAALKPLLKDRDPEVREWAERVLTNDR